MHVQCPWCLIYPNAWCLINVHCPKSKLLYISPCQLHNIQYVQCPCCLIYLHARCLIHVQCPCCLICPHACCLIHVWCPCMLPDLSQCLLPNPSPCCLIYPLREQDKFANLLISDGILFRSDLETDFSVNSVQFTNFRRNSVPMLTVPNLRIDFSEAFRILRNERFFPKNFGIKIGKIPRNSEVRKFRRQP